jgi:Vitamin K-dependent gamma-carboxylase
VNRLVPTSAESLGIGRVIVHGLFLISTVSVSFSSLAEFPATVLRPAGIMQFLPWRFYDQLLTPAGMTIFKVVMVVSLCLSTAGLFTPVSTKLSLVLVVLFQGLVRSLGHFNHDEMLGVFCLAVLAFTPCGDAFSLDQKFFGRRKERPSFAYGYPILLMRLLVAWLYFSSALIKLRVSGLGYLSVDNLPVLSIDHSLDNLHGTAFRYAFWLPQVRTFLPYVMALVLLWELSFPLAVVSRRLRWWILGGGVVFHLSTLFFMNIFFPHTLALYLLFVDWNALIQRLKKDVPEPVNGANNVSMPVAPD